MALETLTEQELEEHLSRVPSWELREGALHRRFSFSDFKEAMVFVNKVAEVAEKNDHHPDISISYNQVTIDLSTHSVGGVTKKDISLAEKIDRL